MWPYLEQFAYDAAVELREELGAKPDFIIGNYSDGNLVATLMAKHMQVRVRISAQHAWCKDQGPAAQPAAGCWTQAR